MDARNVLLGRLKNDLVGPSDLHEIISDRPTDRYLTGILFPQRAALPREEDIKDAESDDGNPSDTSQDGIRASATFRPSSAGLSFAVRPTSPQPVLEVCIEAARYQTSASDGNTDNTQSSSQSPHWKRLPLSAVIRLSIPDDCTPSDKGKDLASYGIPDAHLHVRASRWEDVWLVTIALTNEAQPAKARSREANEMAALFQVSLSVRCLKYGSFIPKPDQVVWANADEDSRAAALLYRDVRQWAVGHTCSAVWQEEVDGSVTCLSSSWLPETTVHVVSAAGSIEFQTEAARQPLCAYWLSRSDEQTLSDGLETFVEAYTTWIARTEAELETLQETLVSQGQTHISRCREAAKRMRRGIALLLSDPEALQAFRMANAAMALQYSWRDNPSPPQLTWRPFQLGFALLCLESIANPSSPDREIMDLLWFPTGGGKTEAYLLLTAFTTFLRRIRAKGDACGAGVTVFMRYTLRLLTIQQFERAAALICACELVRQGHADIGAATIPPHFATDAPISLGLWVGGDATPNTVKEAEAALAANAHNSPAQLRACPCCHQSVVWCVSEDGTHMQVRCLSEDCEIGSRTETLPIWTVDDDVYAVQPTLLIGTIDKFAQLVRNQKSGSLFGLGTPTDPPALIIQDELHLISGPLGSLAGLYEIAIDEFCRLPSGHRVKILGSTATIRRAEDQIHALFDRQSFQFPPPGLIHTDSGFAVEDRNAPGRHYVGVSTAGRSAKFAQQAIAASLLQSATDRAIDNESRNGYWTLVSYFNSLRELGGALSLMRDDVERSLRDYASRREGEAPRQISNQIELTSRVNSGDIPVYLQDLERDWQDPDHIDAVMASNMISVGMDVPRLGLMLVNGQPKTIAEYIQATSRVGRDRRFPGLVITLFNVGKSRDRSRYETFSTWHRSLYRDVEATSVTPFAPRARDRALHAPLVAMVRHLIPGMDQPGQISNHEAEVGDLLDRLLSRIDRIDPSETEFSRSQLEEFIGNWFDWDNLTSYWDDRKDALLTSAETALERGSRGRSKKQRLTPNSLRTVEASAQFVMLENPRQQGNA